MKDITFYIFLHAISKNLFFKIKDIQKIMKITSIADLYTHLCDCTITFMSENKVSVGINEIISATGKILDKLKEKLSIPEYEGSKEFFSKYIKEIFINKEIIVEKKQKNN